jgi:formamidopyrimidine-DNA glycosylase
VPEIAEVEIVRRGLSRLEGQDLESFKASEKMKAHGQEDRVIGRRVTRVIRHGKLLGFDFEQAILTAHLRMTGRFVFSPDQPARAEMRFSKDQVSFLDPRGFATMEVIDPEDWPMGLGPDLWSVLPDPDWLPPEKVMSSKRAAKAVLLDQKVLAGIGNYLADEALWRSSVSPTARAVSLSPHQWRQLIEEAGVVSKAALQHGGTTIRDYVDTEGQSGSGQNELQAYGRAGLPCLRCHSTLEKGRVAGRGTTWCPSCQS